uniref:DNA polymerase n=1 Tax=viral metagenome TaxID=1070528 RepID=A0A6C0EQL8_9ZZZZ
MEKDKFFSYSWHIDEHETECTVIRIYGLNEKNENTCVVVKDFTPYVYIELPDTIEWDVSKAQLVANKIDSLLYRETTDKSGRTGALFDHRPIVKQLMFKKRLYYAKLSKNGDRRLFPYLFCSFAHKEDIKQLGYKIRRPILFNGIGSFTLKIHEDNASPILQLTSLRKLPTAGWISFIGKRVSDDDKVSRCKHEYNVKWKNLVPIDSDEMARPLIMGYDIEVNSSIPSAMPKSHRPDDKVFQISCVFARQGAKEETYEKYILTLGVPDFDFLEDVIVDMYDTEHDLLLGFTRLMQEKQPNVIIGYNIFGFDIPYMIDRAKQLFCIYDFDRQGLDKYGHASERVIKWSSSAYKNQSFQFLDAEGRIFVDLLPLVKRDYKMSNYKLKTIAAHFLKGQTKDPLDPKGIFKCYRLGMKGGRKGERALGIVSKYCLAQGTQVSGIHGTVSIERLVESKNQLLSWDGTKDQIIISEQANFYDNGIRRCIKLELLDGRTITCTPDHKIADKNGNWIEAGDISVGTYIKIGPELPETQLETGNMIFARLLGYILTDGHIGKERCNFYVGNLLDAQNIINDIEKICGIRPNINKNGNCWVITAPSLLGIEIRAVANITIGNRTEGAHGLPNTTEWNEYMIKEFLGGLFGGDGWSTSLRAKSTFTSIGLTQSRKTRIAVVEYMEIVSKLLERFGISSSSRITVRGELFIGSLVIKVEHNEKFMKCIGYRYCYHKTIRTSVSVMYYRFRNRVIAGYKILYNKIKQLTSRGFSIQKAYNQFINEIEYPPKYGTVKCWMRTGFPIGRPDQASREFPKADKFIEMIGATDLFHGDAYHTYSMTKEQTFLPTLYMPIISVSDVGEKHVYDIEVRDTHSFLANGIVVHNCVQDSLLVVKLFETLTTWVALCEMSKVTNVPIFALYTQGQQLKVFSQVYKKCTHENTVVERNGYIPGANDHYVGATVFPPIPGVYDKVIPFDFSSLYPTTIIAHNISWDTLVPVDSDIPDSKCHVMIWYDHLGCSHDPKEIRKVELNKIIKEKDEKIKELRRLRDLKSNKNRKEEFKIAIDEELDATKPFREERSNLQKSKPKHKMCCERRFRWLKEPMGVLPEILTHLLDTRKATKKIMKGVYGKLKELDVNDEKYDLTKTYHEVLDKRQLALKVSANSVPADTPIPCKINGKFVYRTIEELSCGNWTVDKDGNELCSPMDGLEVWSDIGFTKVKYVFRHKAMSQIKRINTHTGCVDCTEDHSLLLPSGEEVKPCDVKIGDSLLHMETPLPNDSPKTPLYMNLTDQDICEYTLKSKNEEMAFVHGLFFAEGTCQKLPDYIFHSYFLIRQAFFMGYCAGNGNRSIVIKDGIGAAGLMYLARSIGYKVSVSSDNGMYRLHCCLKFVNETDIKKITIRQDQKHYVYDIETESHHFAAGVGNMIVHNSAYGAMGVQRGYLPLMPGAMSTTYKGRLAVQLAADSIQKDHKGKLIYGDTDSNYISFPHLSTAKECWDHAVKVANEVTKLYPSPMNLAFEEKIYWRFFIITKKRYMSLACESDGVIETNKDGTPKINKKGVLLQRRDNCNFIRKVYAKVIMDVFNQVDRDIVLYDVIQEINNLCAHYYGTDQFIITKSIGDIGDLQPEEKTDEKGKLCWYVGDYKVKILPTDEKKREHQYQLKKCNTPKEYYLKCMGAHVQLAERMRRRGQLVAPGSRLEYVITTNGGHAAKQYEKVESADYFAKHSLSLEIDYMYYLKQLSNPLDQVLNIMYDKDDGNKYKFKRNFVLEQYKYRLKVRTKMLNELKALFAPKIKFLSANK